MSFEVKWRIKSNIWSNLFWVASQTDIKRTRKYFHHKCYTQISAVLTRNRHKLSPRLPKLTILMKRYLFNWNTRNIKLLHFVTKIISSNEMRKNVRNQLRNTLNEKRHCWNVNKTRVNKPIRKITSPINNCYAHININK